MSKEYRCTICKRLLIHFVEHNCKPAEARAAGYAAGIEDAAKLTESRRQRVLANSSDPSWTEHFAELQGEIRALKDGGR